MKIFWVIRITTIKKWAILLVAALFTAGVIYADQDQLAVFLQTDQQEPQAIYRVETDEMKLALTFDISWGSERQGPILDILEQKGVSKATFFLSSPWAEYHPEIVSRIKDMGFEIGSHGHKYIPYTRLKDDEIREQIVKAHRTLKSLTGITPTLLRTPNGDVDQRVLNIAEELGYSVIQWDTDSKDWMNPGVEQIVDNVISNAHPGDIILLHASDSCKQTHEALPIIIDQLRNKGFEFVTVSELISGVEANVSEVN